jgi:hypothetical protein
MGAYGNDPMFVQVRAVMLQMRLPQRLCGLVEGYTVLGDV